MTIDNNVAGLTQGAHTLGVDQAAQTSQTGQTSIKSHDGHHDHDGDQVQLSDLASQLSAQASDTDPSKLARLQAAFESGTYNVSPSQIANSIIGDALSN